MQPIFASSHLPNTLLERKRPVVCSMAAAAAQAVWICSFPSTARLRAADQTETHHSRRPAPGQAQNASQYKYKRWKRAAESDLARLGFAADQQLNAQGCHALGVAVVKPGLVWDGPVSPWPEAALMQRACHQQAEDACHMEVVEVSFRSRNVCT